MTTAATTPGNTASTTPDSAAKTPPSAWQNLPSLPDPVGFGGMFAGVSKDGTLFTGGGSRFIDKPVWNGGTKVLSDKVFLLKSPSGPWTESPDRLPKVMAHGACTPYGSDVLVAGGTDKDGPMKDVYRFGLQGDKLTVESLPPLPQAIVYGAAAVVDDVLYIIGGAADPAFNQPFKECWSLPLKPSVGAWKKVADFPGKPAIVMAAGSDGKSLYAFGGMHYIPADDGKSRPVPQDNAYRFDPATNTWRQLEDLPFARVGAASPAPLLPDGKLLLAGGYGFVFSGLPKDHPGFEAETLIYSPSTNGWKEGPPLPCERKPNPDLPSSPGPEPMVAAPAVIWRDMVVLISGEVRPATRTPAVIGLPLSSL